MIEFRDFTFEVFFQCEWVQFFDALLGRGRLTTVSEQFKDENTEEDMLEEDIDDSKDKRLRTIYSWYDITFIDIGWEFFQYEKEPSPFLKQFLKEIDEDSDGNFICKNDREFSLTLCLAGFHMILQISKKRSADKISSASSGNELSDSKKSCCFSTKGEIR